MIKFVLGWSIGWACALAYAAWSLRGYDIRPRNSDVEFPLDSRVRNVLLGWEGTVVAIDSTYEIECDDGTSVTCPHRALEPVDSTRKGTF